MRALVMTVSAAACALALAAPASACRGGGLENTIYPVMESPPAEETYFVGTVLKIRYSGVREGETNRLWPNFYKVDVIEGPYEGRTLLIPAYVTSCDAVYIEERAEGYVVGRLNWLSSDGEPYAEPRLTIMRGLIKRGWRAE